MGGVMSYGYPVYPAAVYPSVPAYPVYSQYGYGMLPPRGPWGPSVAPVYVPSPFTLLAFMLVTAERRGIPWQRITGTSNQSDYLSHYVANHMFFRLALPGARRMLTDGKPKRCAIWRLTEPRRVPDWERKSSDSQTEPPRINSSIEMVCPGLVPHETCGRSAVASMMTSFSNGAPGSVGSARHSSSACSHAAPFGANVRPSR